MVDPSIASNLPFWWLETSFGKLVFILFFVTWGLLVIVLVLAILYLLHKLLNK